MAERKVLIHGDASFRPSCMAVAPDASVYVNDWADREYSVHGKGRIWKISAKEFSEVIDVNIKGVANVLRHFLPAMVERKSGVIVNFSSGWGRSTAAEVAPYCATKWAIEGLTQALAQELPAGMAAIPLNPGIINTEMLQSCFGGSASARLINRESRSRSSSFSATVRNSGLTSDSSSNPRSTRSSGSVYVLDIQRSKHRPPTLQRPQNPVSTRDSRIPEAARKRPRPRGWEADRSSSRSAHQAGPSNSSHHRPGNGS